MMRTQNRTAQDTSTKEPTAMPKTINVALLTARQGAHLEIYLNSLAALKEVGTVTLGDPSGSTFALAKKILGRKLAQTSKDIPTVLASRAPQLALVTMEAVMAPPVIDRAL